MSSLACADDTAAPSIETVLWPNSELELNLVFQAVRRQSRKGSPYREINARFKVCFNW